MTVSLVKPPYIPERAPLWWDDASYIRYQSDCGPEGEWIYELNVGDRFGDAPIVRRWVWYDEFVPASSRAVRRLIHRFDAQMVAIREAGTADRATVDGSIPF